MTNRSALRFALGAGLLLILAGGAIAGQKYLAPYPEAAVIAAGAKDADELSARFQALVRERGGPYAFEVLERAELPLDGNLHGFAHSIAEAVYEEKGPDALGECPAHFQPACGHEFAHQSLQQFGLSEGVRRFAEACKTVPGGKSGHHECFHGLGHGLMEFLGYSFPDALAACGGVNGSEGYGPEYAQCAGGAMMEILRGGEAAQKDNPPEWYAARPAYLSAKEPLSFCLGALVPEPMKETCVSLSAPWILESSGFRFLAEEASGLSSAFEVCGALSSSSPRLRDACFGGLGNEFALLEGGNEISRADDYGPEVIARLAGRCEAGPAEDGRRACLMAIFNALSRVEGGGKSLLQTLCARSDDTELQKKCLL